MTRLACCLSAAALLFPMGHAARAFGDERVEGIVQRTRITHCDVTKTGGCAGTLIVERGREGKSDLLTIRVPLGTPISCAGERVHLHALQGKTVIVTLPGDGSDSVARAIQVAEAEPC